ncbi:MAG: hypothetical protein FWF09_03370 [Bacteroidales bacterium]|nr:hypothetical protein [Bacteroidales bacterium]
MNGSAELRLRSVSESTLRVKPAMTRTKARKHECRDARHCVSIRLKA